MATAIPTTSEELEIRALGGLYSVTGKFEGTPSTSGNFSHQVE